MWMLFALQIEEVWRYIWVKKQFEIPVRKKLHVSPSQKSILLLKKMVSVNEATFPPTSIVLFLKKKRSYMEDKSWKNVWLSKFNGKFEFQKLLLKANKKKDALTFISCQILGKKEKKLNISFRFLTRKWNFGLPYIWSHVFL